MQDYHSDDIGNQ